MKTLFLMLFAVAGSALAQTTAPPLAPGLAPLAAKHKADPAAVEQQRGQSWRTWGDLDARCHE